MASPKSIITFVNSRSASFCIPSCPAASVTPAISSALAGNSFAIFRIPCSNAANSSSVASTVFLTPANALSKSIDDLIAIPPTAARGKLTDFVNVFPVSVIVLPTFLNPCEIFEAVVCAVFSMFDNAVLNCESSAKTSI